MTRPMLEVLEPGLHSSVQDLGRPGLQHQGVAEGGALDPRALFEGAALLGQAPELAALEMTAIGGAFRAEGEAVRVALTGAPFEARADGIAVPWRTALTLEPGQTLQLGKAQNGLYGYLHLGGGIDVLPVLGSRSTHLRAGFGGHEGRLMRKGDHLQAGEAATTNVATMLDLPAPDALTVVRVLWGVHADEFDEAERNRFLGTTFRVSAKRDRMGAVLDGAEPGFTPERGRTLISDAVVQGDIQVPGDGRPVVLLADRQPTGGYPRIATVISADLPGFAQLPSGAPLRFEVVEPDAAVAALRAFRAYHAALGRHVRARRPGEELLAVNLVDGVYAGATEP